MDAAWETAGPSGEEAAVAGARGSPRSDAADDQLRSCCPITHTMTADGQAAPPPQRPAADAASPQQTDASAQEAEVTECAAGVFSGTDLQPAAAVGEVVVALAASASDGPKSCCRNQNGSSSDIQVAITSSSGRGSVGCCGRPSSSMALPESERAEIVLEMLQALSRSGRFWLAKQLLGSNGAHVAASLFSKLHDAGQLMRNAVEFESAVVALQANYNA